MSRERVIALSGSHGFLVEQYLAMRPAVAAALGRAGATVVVAPCELEHARGLAAEVQHALDAAEVALPADVAAPLFVLEALRAFPHVLARPALPVRTARGRFAGLLLPGEGGAAFYDAEGHLHGARAPGLERFALRLIAEIPSPGAH